MLIRFKATNFLSYAAPVVLDLTAHPAVPHEPQHLSHTPGFPPVLRLAVVYGTNGTGKSNLVRALRYAREIVRFGTPEGEDIPLFPFRLREDALQAPSAFAFELLIEGLCYHYQFSVSRMRVESERLELQTPDAQQVELIFERLAAEYPGDPPQVTLGEGLGDDPGLVNRLAFIGETTRANQLFLTELCARGVHQVSTLTSWFHEDLLVQEPGRTQYSLPLEFESYPKMQELSIRLLQRAGANISQLSTTDPFLPGEYEKLAPMEHILVNTVSVMEKWRSDARSMWDATQRSHLYMRFEHDVPNQGSRKLTWMEESSGLRKLVELTPDLYRLGRSERSPVLLIDEFDRDLHTKTKRELMTDFLASATTGQLIVTSHDAHLLDLSLLSRDSIWFAERGPSGQSHLYSLATLTDEELAELTAPLADLELQGRFGRLPFYADPARLGWYTED